jgi:hypothetical protein
MYEYYNLSAIRKPDEAFITINKNTTPIIKILEKKYQSVEGSIDTKLWAGPGIKKEYEIYYNKFKISYAFCLSEYLENKMKLSTERWRILNIILNENDIKLFYNTDINYYNKIIKWGFSLE